MNKLSENKDLILRYGEALSKEKTLETCQKFTTDQELIEHIQFFESVFPNYQVFPDEMIAEGNKVVMRARLTGRHEGEFQGIPPTHKDIEFPFVIMYQIENGKIVDHWLIADQMTLMEQLGAVEAKA
jgi:predicted ester cyclase